MLSVIYALREAAMRSLQLSFFSAVIILVDSKEIAAMHKVKEKKN